MTRQFMYSKLFTALALTVQRYNVRLPEWILCSLRPLLIRLMKDEAGSQNIKDWSIPLITRRKQALSTSESPIFEFNSPASVKTELLDISDSVKPSINGVDTKATLKCLLVTSALDVGGLDEVVAFLARRLPRHNIHTAVLHASIEGAVDGIPSGRLGRMLLKQGVETVELSESDGTRWLEAWRPDVISAHGAPLWVLETANRLSIPYVETLHGLHSHFDTDWAAETGRGRRLAGIITVSEQNKRQYLDGNPTFPKERIITIPNGVDDERRVLGDRHQIRARLGIRDEYLFVSLARHCLQKNTYGLVSGFEAVAAQHPEAHLVIAGHPSDKMYFSQVLRLRASLACRDRIHLRDHANNPAELLAAADGFVLDSFFEGWSLASMEALYSGLPVVLSEVGGACEQVGAREERGHVIPNPLGDPLRVNWQTMREVRFASQINREALVVAMNSLITNRSYWLDRRQQLIDESAQRFHPDICLHGHAQALKAVVRGESLQQYEDILHYGL